MRPGPRKLKQSLPVIVGFGIAGRKHRLFSVLPELICYRHGHPPAPQHPDTSMCAVGGLSRVAKVSNFGQTASARKQKWADERSKRTNRPQTQPTPAPV